MTLLMREIESDINSMLNLGWKRAQYYSLQAIRASHPLCTLYLVVVFFQHIATMKLWKSFFTRSISVSFRLYENFAQRERFCLWMWKGGYFATIVNEIYFVLLMPFFDDERFFVA